MPSLPLFEHLSQWGTIRLNPLNLDNVINVELKRLGSEEQWRPLLQLCVIDNRVAMRLMAENNERTLVYEPTTNTFSNLASQDDPRDGNSVRQGQAGEDDAGDKDDS